MNDALTAVDKEGTVLYWNRAAEDMYGIARDSITGRKISEFFQENSLMLSQVINSDVPVYRVYHRPRADKHVLINAVPVHSKAGELIGAVSVERDITSIVRLNEEQHRDNYSPSLTRESSMSSGYSQTLETLANFVVNSANNTHNFPFLITGESGVGKRTLAELVHQRSSGLNDFSFLPCDALPQGFIENQLFGYEKDMFGEVLDTHPGYLERTGQGTLYLINVHTLPAPIQQKLALALRDQHFYRMGGNDPIPLNCRVLASAPPNAAELLVNELLYAFQRVTVPPLRERREELTMLFNFFLGHAAAATNRPIPNLSAEAVVALTTYHWPGNVPELRNTAEHVLLSAKFHEVGIQDLPANIRPKTIQGIAEQLSDLQSWSQKMERDRILDALAHTGGNKADAARALGISRGTLYYKLKKLKLINSSSSLNGKS